MHQIRQKNQNPAKEMQPDRRSRRRSTIAPTSGARPTSALIDRTGRSTIAPRDLVDRAARRHGAIVSTAARSGLSLLSLSLIWALSSLSLSLSLFPEVI